MKPTSAPLANACLKITDGTHHSPPIVANGVPYVTAKHIKPDGIRFFDDPWYVSHQDHAEIYSRCDPKPGDVLYIKDGATTGVAAVNSYDFPFSMLSSVALLRPDPEVCDGRYLAAWLNSPRARREYLGSMGGAAIKRLTLAKIKAFRIPLPSLPEQKRIAAILDAADALRAQRRESIEQLDSLIQATFLEMFGDPVTNPKGWPEMSLVSLCASADDMRCGPFGTQLRQDEFAQEGVPLWGIKHVNAGFDLDTDEFVSPDKAKQLALYCIRAGDLVMTRKGTIGNCHVYPSKLREGIMHSDLLRIRLDGSRAHPVFLSTQLKYSVCVQHQLRVMSPGAVMPGINVTKLKTLRVLNSSLDLQTRFASIVESIEQQKVHLKAHLAELDTLFASLQSRAFNGELVA
jgi:type I restriction enzyme S subunit